MAVSFPSPVPATLHRHHQQNYEQNQFTKLQQTTWRPPKHPAYTNTQRQASSRSHPRFASQNITLAGKLATQNFPDNFRKNKFSEESPKNKTLTGSLLYCQRQATTCPQQSMAPIPEIPEFRCPKLVVCGRVGVVAPGTSAMWTNSTTNYLVGLGSSPNPYEIETTISPVFKVSFSGCSDATKNLIMHRTFCWGKANSVSVSIWATPSTSGGILSACQIGCG